MILKFKVKNRLLFFVSILLFSSFYNAQTDTVLHPQKDIVDVYYKIINHKCKAPSHCEPKKISFSSAPGIGYTLHTKFAVAYAMNFAFHTSKDKKTNLSVINVLPVLSQSKQFEFLIQSNIWAKQNKYNFQGDYRYYKYPQYSYGLGGHTSLAINNFMDYSYIVLKQAVLKSFGNNFFGGGGYNFDYHTHITESGNSDGNESDFDKYGATISSISTGPSLHFLHDNRKNLINPLAGLYTNVVYRYNLKILGSTTNWQSLIIDARKYIKLPGKSRNILAFWSYNWFTFGGKAPYLDLPGTAWDTYSNIGRGYTQSRFTGKNLLYLEAEYRFTILKNGLLGGVVFTNVQSVSDWPGNKFTVLWPAAGFGLRVKVNKHSNTNISIDYGIGLGGSNGFFVNLGEVF